MHIFWALSLKAILTNSIIFRAKFYVQSFRNYQLYYFVVKLFLRYFFLCCVPIFLFEKLQCSNHRRMRKVFLLGRNCIHSGGNNSTHIKEKLLIQNHFFKNIVTKLLQVNLTEVTKRLARTWHYLSTGGLFEPKSLLIFQ